MTNPWYPTLDYPYKSYPLFKMHKRNPKSWKRRSASERGLAVLTVTGVLLCIGQVVGRLAEIRSEQPTTTDVQVVPQHSGIDDVCLSPECRRIASTVLQSMDPNVDPCDDFYRFACGGFLNSTIVPEGREYVNVFTGLEDQLQQQLRACMEEPSEPNELKTFRLVKNLYKSCMNETAIESQGLEPIHKILKKLGGWPVLDGVLWNETDFDWINVTYKFREVGYSVNYFFSFETIENWENPPRTLIVLDSGYLGLFDEYLLEGVDHEDVMAYYDYMVDIAVLLGAERERASTDLRESLLFEINLANISLPHEERDFSPHPLKNLSELTKDYPSIPWREYFRKILPNEIAFEENEVAVVYVPSYISNLEKLIANTPKRVQANYMIWRAVQVSVAYLNDNIRRRELAYLTALNGKTPTKSRWEECVDHVITGLPIAVGAMYVRKFSNNETKQYVVDMVMDIKTQYSKIIQQIEWMDNNMRQNSLRKIAAIFNHVAYPDELLNDTKLESLYENLELSGGNFLDNVLNVFFFGVELSYRKLHELVNKNDWDIHAKPFIIEAYYLGYSNSIHLPAAILQDPFFSIDRPRYMNYGNIGFVIAHEINHAFENIEVHSHVDENMSDWSSNNENYLERVQCINHQYGNYTVEEVGLNLDGIKTNIENIADFVGMKIAYLAYKDWVKANEPEKKLPGLPYSLNQMFWIVAANPWCTKWESEALKDFITVGPHSPQEFRILGSLSNIPAFANDFSCPTGSKMNPQKKCSVW